VLELSGGVRSLPQVPWWDAGRRAHPAGCEPHPLMRLLDYCACRRPASFYFVARVSEARPGNGSQARYFFPDIASLIRATYGARLNQTKLGR
jgi:hypothetical protein